ncbi:MAG TPA: hypothetical protein VJS11_11455, partial [Acidobacteriaceae bacterium]|nr:hypothetical protein [Acidobacteriaceae bacterium]
IVYGPLSGQLTAAAALGETLRQVDSSYGDRPQLGKMLQNQAGTVWEGFFTVTDKKSGSAKMTGMVIVYAPKTGTAGGAYLIDTSDDFPQSVNSMLQTLVQRIASGGSAGQGSPQQGNGSAPAASAPPQRLTPVVFPDNSGSMGLPPGWKMLRAQLGDVSASGPNGEMLRFGLTISVLDPTSPQSRGLMGRGGPPGNFLAIPYNVDGSTLFAQMATQIAQKTRTQAPKVTIQNVQNLPIQGGRNYMFYGEVDRGQGPQALVAQVIVSPPQAMGAYQVTVFQITAPPQVMVSEASTIAEIYPNYSRNTRYVNAVANAQILQGIQQEKQFVGTVGQYIDSSDRLGAGMSNYLRGQTVIRDTQTGAHATTSDALADLLTQSNPNQFETVPQSQYIRGIDY